MKRPMLTDRESSLLRELQIMKLWVVMHLEPAYSGRGAIYEALKRDMQSASKAIAEATGGNEE